MGINKHIFISLFTLLFFIIAFGYSGIDFVFEDKFFNFSTHTWILDRNEKVYKLIFYDGIKKVLILIAVVLLLSLVFFSKTKLIKEYKKGIIIVILSAILVPLTVGALKKYTNMPCPKNTIHYGGIYPDSKVWESYPKEFKVKKKLRCWPAGHASGGFALFSLFFLFKKSRNKKLAILFALGIGWSMGIYKMLIGDHFLSHTVITMILAWLIILVIAKIINPSTLRL